jgi:hypothetical protein
MRSRDISVGMTTGYGLDGRDSIPGTGKRFFSIPQRTDWLWGPPNLLSDGYRGALYLVVKRPGRETDHSPPSSVEVKNGGAIPPLLYTYVFMACCLIKHRNNFTFTGEMS